MGSTADCWGHRSSGVLCSGVELRLDLASDRPDETEQLAADCRDDAAMMLPLRGELLEALVQPVLRVPGDRFDVFVLVLLTLSQCWSVRRAMPVRPRRFSDDVAHPRVACLRDRPATCRAA